MLKYVDTKVVFSEIPNEITLAINISGCPIHCEECHSKYLWEDIGKPLGCHAIDKMITSNEGVTCICFMGGDYNPGEINLLAEWIKMMKYPVKVAWYSGKSNINYMIELKNFEYIKVGPFIKEKGPINEPTTNQRLYKIVHCETGTEVVQDITYMFWKKNAKD